MKTGSAIAVYFITWWLCLFVTLPFGVKNPHEAGEPFRDRLFGLPAFLREAGAAAPPRDVAEGLKLAAYFLERHFFEPQGQHFPEQQDWIIRILAETPH